MSVRLHIDDKLMKQLEKAIKETSKIRVVIGITDPDVAKYASFVEFGWAQRVTQRQHNFFFNQGIDLKVNSLLINPPRPFFRDTINKYLGLWCKVGIYNYKAEIKSDPLNIGNASFKYLESIGRLGKNGLQATIGSGGVEFGYPQRSNLTITIMSTFRHGKPIGGGTKPLEDTGRLFDSINYEMCKEN